MAMTPARELTRWPSGTAWPAGRPTGPRACDSHTVVLSVWVSPSGELESFLYIPEDMDELELRRHLRELYGEVLRYRGEPERLYRRGRHPLNNERFRQLDVGCGRDGAWGPGLAHPVGKASVTLETLTEAAILELRAALG